MFHIDKRIDAVEIDISGMNHIHFSKVNHGIAIRMSLFDMKGMNRLTIKVKSHRIAKGNDRKGSGGRSRNLTVKNLEKLIGF